jgi:hypothetical protein
LRIGHGVAVVGVPIFRADFRPFKNARPADDGVKNNGRRMSGTSVFGKRFLENTQQVLFSTPVSGAHEYPTCEPSAIFGRYAVTKNAWAKFERAEVNLEEFDELFAVESLALGAAVRGKDVLPLLSGDLLPEMVEALRRVKTKFKTGCMTNNLPANSIGSGSGSGSTAGRPAGRSTSRK